MIILGPKTAILGPQFCRILVLGPHFWWSGGPRPPEPPLDPPLLYVQHTCHYLDNTHHKGHNSTFTAQHVQLVAEHIFNK